jgi:hypothetical protein
MHLLLERILTKPNLAVQIPAAAAVVHQLVVLEVAQKVELE